MGRIIEIKNGMRKRFYALWFAFVLSGLMSAAELPEGGLGLLTRIPDLLPSLTKEEVAKDFGPWSDKVAKVLLGWGMEQTISFSRAHRELSPRIPVATKIVLYSLVPAQGEALRKRYPERVQEYEKLPKFHGYPVLGSVNMEADGEAGRWSDFLKSQIIPGPSFLCDFEPRHGLSFVLPTGQVDILICFKCSELSLPGSVKLDVQASPMFSPVVEQVMNRLLDKNKVIRDDPQKKPAAAGQ